jgi:AraC-like DNA-binding protein
MRYEAQIPLPFFQRNLMEQAISKYCGYFWAGHFMYLGRCPANTVHMHYALQVIVNREGLFQLRREGSSVECAGVIVGSGCPHQLVSPVNAHSWIHLLIDHESEVAKAITKRHLGQGEFKVLDGGLLERLRGCIEVPGNFLGSCRDAGDVYKKLVTELGGYPEQAAEAVDPRVRAAIDLLKGKYLARKVVVSDLARHACLSESRLRHLFAGQIGMPIRRYVLWLRLMTAVQFAVQGESLTQAAHSAGFSDSAHLCRTFRRMYGVTLSGLIKNSRFVQVISCFS